MFVFKFKWYVFPGKVNERLRDMYKITDKYVEDATCTQESAHLCLHLQFGPIANLFNL